MNIKSQLRGGCRHATSIRDNETCKAGMVYDEIMKRKELGDVGCMVRLPCSGKPVGSITRGHTVQPCNKYDPLTEEEIEQEEREIQEIIKNIASGVSSCCKAPIDESRVIPDGQHKGHGPRYCSKCKKLVYMV